MQNCAIYARYSSSAQRDVSIDQQIDACRTYAARQGLTVTAVYEDRAYTGTNDKRPGFRRMISDAPKGKWEYVVVYALDRFARNRYDSAINKQKLKECGVRVLSATQNLTDDPTGVLMESILEGFAEYYSLELAQKTTRGMMDNAHKCLVNGPLPAGYKKGPDGKYAINEPEAAVVREIFCRVRDGEQIKTILADFARRGLRNSKGKEWTRSAVNRLLVNERYTGVYLYNDVRIEGGIPAIIDRDLYNAVQFVLGTKQNPRKVEGVPQRRRRENGIYLLTGKLYCGDCKSPMVGVSGRSKGGYAYYYYACQNQRVHKCQMQPVRRDVIEYAITDAIRKYLLNDETIVALADAIIASQAQSQEALELKSMEAELRDVKRSLKNIMQAIENGLYSPTMQKRLMELETRQEELQAAVDYRRTTLQQTMTREDIILTLTLFQDGDPKDKNYQMSILDTFLVRAYVYGDKLKLIFRIGQEKTAETEIPTGLDIDEILPDTPECSYKAPNGSPETPSYEGSDKR